MDYKNIFPDLDGLSKTIIENAKSLAWSKPEPLKLEEIKSNMMPNK